ncbi:MAG: penicillin-binding protein 2 [Actinomyces sp.]|jgi:peptidoglycan glycosyltransferase|uniref:Beta-lactamase n=1 Tax=Schaalia naturae TaxID=635203 RepID=A0ABW2SQ01_9ACTO|nr:penicillin-binding protein 2 [Actinomyces sp.]MCI1642768.1 penicillin-binding protein 2 [Actinomyces sp.]MCI1663196.1 penicillin-binding protein 2 [Actinomyces sp.]MCI1692063.1 penicillin-binding protein 2 [Actinomyces sp.]
MNAQVRRLFMVIVLMFATLGLAATNIQFVQAPTLNADDRNARTILHAAELDRGPIIVAGSAIASSVKDQNDSRYQRTYSDGPLYAPVTGYFSSVFNQATGLEDAAESILEGNSQVLLGQRLRNLFTGQGRVGGGVVLTLDPDMQKAAAEQLGGRKGAVVALDAKTGAVLALYSSPSYDPNPLAQFDSSTANEAFSALDQDASRPLVNRAIAGDRYAPGSTFKILTSIALLENGVATPDTPMDSPVEATLPGTATTISNIESTECGDGTPTLAEAFARSCNTTFVLASEKLTHDELADVANRFGFGDDLSIPLAVTPSVFPDQTDAAQLAMSAIGQYNVQVTPLEMAMVAQTIADDGVMMTPYLIDQVVDADLQVKSTTEPTQRATPVSADIAQEITDMMVGVVNQPYGSGTSMAIDGVTVAAKTGTAELGDTGYANAWAVGFAPAEDPQIAFAVIVEGDDSQPVPHGGTVAGPVARALLEAGLR